MDVITTAILAGATAGLAGGATEVGKQAALDAYSGLKGLLQRTFGANSSLAQAVTLAEAEPDSQGRQLMLAEEVTKAQATEQEALVQAAETVLVKLNESNVGQQALGKFNVQVSGGQVGNIGDQANIQGGIHFGAPPSGGDA